MSSYLNFVIAIDLLERLLKFNPEERISAHDALAHPYFSAVTTPFPINLTPGSMPPPAFNFPHPHGIQPQLHAPPQMQQQVPINNQQAYQRQPQNIPIFGQHQPTSIPVHQHNPHTQAQAQLAQQQAMAQQSGYGQMQFNQQYPPSR